MHGRRLNARFVPSFPWAGPLSAAIHRAVTLSASHHSRFDRIEMSPGDARHRPHPAAPGRYPSHLPSSGVDSGRPLPAALRSRLRDITGASAEVLRVHDDAPADALARARQADAVTVGHNVYFAHGRFQPHDPRGFGLLVHEATHVQALLQPDTAWRRATGAGRGEEEATALARERAATAYPGSLAPDRQRSRTAPPTRTWLPGGTAPPVVASHRSALHGAAPTPIPSSAPATVPMAAASGRDPAAAAPWDVAALRRELLADVVDDLRRRLRTEFERGG
jgi:hypothetical protein